MDTLSINGYEYSNLNEDELDKIKKLEEELNRDDSSEEKILLAFKGQGNPDRV